MTQPLIPSGIPRPLARCATDDVFYSGSRLPIDIARVVTVQTAGHPLPVAIQWHQFGVEQLLDNGQQHHK